MELHNHDIVGFVNRLDRFAKELEKSASGTVSELSVADRARLDSYLASLEAYRDWVVGAPALDLPESHPTTYTVADVSGVDVNSLENEHVKDVLVMIGLTREELIKSQSAKKASGLISFDEGRLTAIINKIKLFLVDYVDQATPLDLPESSPKQG